MLFRSRVLEYNDNMTKENNVIQFPNRGRVVTPAVPTKEELAMNVSMIKYNHINETLETVIPILFHNMDLAGFHLVPIEEDDDPNIRDGALIVESIRSIMCKYYDIQHPFQQLADTMFNPREDGTFALTKKLEMDFSEFEQETSES